MRGVETERTPSRTDSDTQRKLDELAHFRRLEEEGIHTDALIQQESPPLLRVIFMREVGKVHRRLRRSRAPKLP